MKKLIAFILVIAMCLGASAFTVGAAQSAGLIFMPKATYSGTCGTNLSWSLNTSTGVLSITGTGALVSYSDYVPWYSYCSYITKVEIASGVTSIEGSVFRGCSALTSITIPDSITSIGRDAFSYCSRLTSINIPDSVTSIGGGAFRDCSRLTSINIPDSVTTIGSYAFYGCSGLTSINIPDSVTAIGSYAFYGCSGLTKVNITDVAAWCAIQFENSYDNPLYYAKNLYLNGNLVTELIIPDSVTAIGYSAFFNCDSITSITIPDSVTSIGDRAFYNCDSITSITIPDSVTAIGYEAFYNCSGLTSITIPDSVTAIGDYAFSGTGYYNDSTNWENNVLYIGNHLIEAKTALSGAYIIKSGTITVANKAFSGCSSVTGVTIPDSVTAIGRYAFDGCSKLTSITIGAGVTAIGSYAFYDCSKLTSITIPDSVTSIGDSAFYNCDSITSINIPDSVTSIGYDAFYGCSGLTSITIPDSVTAIGRDAFSGTGYYNDSTNWENNVLYIGNHLIEAKTALSGAYTIKSGTITVAKEAFSGCSSVTGVTIPDSVTSIGYHAFYNCSGLTSVTVGAGVASIESNAFNGCTALTKVNITDVAAWCAVQFGSSDANPLYYAKNLYLNGSLVTELVITAGVTSINRFAFYNCTSLTSVTVPDSVTAIGSSAFYDCDSLTSVTVPDSVTSIGYDAFYSCYGLKKVNITDVAAWCAVQFVNSYANPLYYANNLYLNGNLVTELVIPDSITSIGDRAFCNCDSITSVTIPDSVTFVGDGAFGYCSGLTKVNITDVAAWCAIQFENSYANPLYYAKNLYLNGNLVTELIIPDSITSIGDRAFYNCDSITSITIPDSVTSIGYYAFESCLRLETVYYEGSKNKWNDVEIDSGNEYLTSAVFIFSSDRVNFTAEHGSLAFTEVDAVKGTMLSDIAFPEVTADDGYRFVGWDKTEGVIEDGMVVNAVFERVKFYIVFKAEDGSVISQQTVMLGFTAIAPRVPQREGYKSLGWADEDGNIVKSFSNISKDMTLTAAYEQIMVKISFAAELGSLSFTEIEVPYGTELSNITFPAVTPVTGYHFTGWDMTDGVIKAETVVTAQFDINTYTVTFKGADGTVLSQQTVSHGGGVTVPTIPQREGYTIVGWQDVRGNIVSDFGAVTGNSVYTAAYEQIMVKVTFIAENGTLSFAEKTVPYGTQLTHIAYPVVYPAVGYLHTGWDKNEGVIKADTVVTAKFELKTYTVVFMSIDGSTLSRQTVTHGSAVLAPEVPEFEGYEFDCWVDSNGNMAEDFSAVTGNMTLTAAYKQVMVKVNFKAELGSLSFTETEVAYGSYLEDLNYPDVSPAIGYLHTGWDISEGEVTEEITVNAKFELKTYTVIFMGVDGTTLSQQAVKHGFAATVPAVPKFEGYVFDCWADSNGNIISEFDSIIADITVIACYVEGEEAKHFEFAEGADTTNVVVSTIKEQVYFKAGGMTAEDIAALFDGAEISITKANGTTATGTALIGTGAVITSTINGVSESRTVVVLGDINGDGRVTAADYAQVLNCAKGKSALNALKKEAANVIAPGSATINAADYASVLAFAMGKTQKFNSAVV